MFKNFRFQKNNSKTKSKGSTLIEMLIATGIFGIIMLLASTLVISIIRANYKTRIQRQVNDEARNIIETITREAKLAFGREDEEAIKVEEGGEKLVLTESPTLTKSYQLVDAGGGNQSIEVQSTEFTVVPGERPKRDIMLVIDASGSMDVEVNGRKRHEWVKIAIEEFLNSSSLDHAYDQVGLVSFSGATKWLAYPGHSGYYKADGISTIHSGLTADFNSIKNKFSEITFVGTTATGLGMENASNELLNNGRSDAQKFQILLTDGCANAPEILYDANGNKKMEVADECCSGPDVIYSKKVDVPFAITEDLIQDQMDEQIEKAVNNNIAIYTIGFGLKDSKSYSWDQPCCRLWIECLDSIYLDVIAQETEGEYFEVTKPLPLILYFRIIAEKMYQAGPSSPALITSDNVNVKDLQFDLYDDKTQPFLNIEITVESKEYDTSPDWKRASITYKTTISSRDYITE